MAYIKTLKENELIGGQDNTDVYLITTTQAIYSQKPNGTVPEGIKHQKLEERLEDIEEDDKELHRKAEKMVVYITNDKDGQTLEINGSTNTMRLKGKVRLESFGDEADEAVRFEDLDFKRLSIVFGDAILVQDDNWSGDTTYTMPNTAGEYTANFDARRHTEGYIPSATKRATTTTYLNLRKYFGFVNEQPIDPTTLDTSHFSNSVSCTVTIPANGTGFKHIYLAVPNNMTITRVVQPDALNAPLAITQVGTISRVINDQSYTYKLYQSDDMIDSSTSKRLTIS